MTSKSDLTPYQKEAIRRFSRQRVAALFMEMGTGKTRTAVELANLHADRYDIVLWLAPVSTLTNAKEDVAKWGGFTKPSLFYGYESIASSARVYAELREKLKGKRAFLICDESLYLKNGETNRWQKAHDIREDFCDFCILLNGTPMSRDEMDIYWQMEMLSHKVFGMGMRQYRDLLFTRVKLRNRPDFFKRSQKNIPWLKSKIEPYVYECSLQLPARLSETMERVRFTESRDEEYDEIRSGLRKADTDEVIMGGLTLLRKCAACNEAKNRKIAEEIADRRVVVFTQFRAEQKQICGMTKNGCFAIDGETPRAERDETIANWKRGQKPLVIMSQCGAFGLNLQESSDIYFASLPWDFAEYSQAIHRCYRLGQTDAEVRVHRFATRCGISELVEDCLFTKSSLAEVVRITDWRKTIGVEKDAEEVPQH